MKMYVGNLSRTMTEDILRNAFEQFGEVISVKLIKDRETGELRGFGFVEMADSEKAQDAMASLNGAELDGQRIRVNEARPQEDRGGSSFRSGPRGPRTGGMGGSRSGGSDRGGSSFGGSRSSFGGGRDRSNKFSGGGWR